MPETNRCPRCNGRMVLDSFNQACDECRENGATVCGNCWIHYELSCVQCGHVKYFPRKRRKDMANDYPGSR